MIQGLLQNKYKHMKFQILSIMIIYSTFECSHANLNIQKMSIFSESPNGTNSTTIESYTKYDSNKIDSTLEILICQNIKLFYQKIIVDSNTKSNQYDNFFGQNGETELIMKQAYIAGILNPFTSTNDPQKSIALEYVYWRITKECNLTSTNELSIRFFKEYQGDYIFRASLKGCVFYFQYNLTENSNLRIADIYDSSKTTLIPDNNIWSKFK